MVTLFLLFFTANMVDLPGNQTMLTVQHLPNSSPFSCIANHPGVFQSCEVSDPSPGDWEVTYSLTSGFPGNYQINASLFQSYCALDIDGDGEINALTDGLLILRHLFGLSGNGLTHDAIGFSAWRSSSEDVISHINQTICQTTLDIDGNGTLDALTDGLLIIRYLFGLKNQNLIQNAIGDGASRSDPIAIESWLDTLTTNP